MIERPGVLIAIGAILEVVGLVLAWLLFLRIIPITSLLLDLFAFAASVAGLMLGMVGGVTYYKQYKNKAARQQDQ